GRKYGRAGSGRPRGEPADSRTRDTGETPGRSDATRASSPRGGTSRGSTARGGAARSSTPRGGTARERVARRAAGRGSTASGDTAVRSTARGGTARGSTARGDTPPGNTARGDSRRGSTARGTAAPAAGSSRGRRADVPDRDWPASARAQSSRPVRSAPAGAPSGREQPGSRPGPRSGPRSSTEQARRGATGNRPKALGAQGRRSEVAGGNDGGSSARRRGPAERAQRSREAGETGLERYSSRGAAEAQRRGRSGRPGAADRDSEGRTGQPARARRTAGPGRAGSGKAGGDRARGGSGGWSSANGRQHRSDERSADTRTRLPAVPRNITADQLDLAARAELRTLPGDLAESVARFLVAAGTADNPDRGYDYALAARR